MIALIIGRVTRKKFVAREEIYLAEKEKESLFKKYMRLSLEKNEAAFIFFNSGGSLNKGARSINCPKPIL